MSGQKQSIAHIAVLDQTLLWHDDEARAGGGQTRQAGESNDISLRPRIVQIGGLFKPRFIVY